MKLVSIHKQLLFLTLLLVGFYSTNAQVLSLEECIEKAMVNNKKLKIGKNNITMGKERQSQVKANLLPKVKIETDYKYFIDLPTQLMPMSVFGGPEGQFREAQFGVPHNINANLQFAMPLYNPALKSNIENSKIGIELAELQYQKSEEQISFDIANLYYNAQILLSQMKFIDDNLVNSNKFLTNIKLLNKHLLAKKTDVQKVELQVLQLNSKHDILQSTYDQVMNGMKTLMGVALDEKIEVESNIVYQQVADYSILPSIDMRMVATKDRLLKGELNTLKKSELPTVALYGSYGLVGYGYDKSPNAFLDFYRMGFVGVKASYSLFDGKITKKKKSLKQREIANNSLQLQLLQDQNSLQIKNANLKKTISNRSLKTTQAQIDFAQSIYDQTVIQQKEGVASVTDVLLSDNALREAQQNYISSIIEYLKADLELKKLTGHM